MELFINKPVYFCLHGPSLHNLDDNIEKFADKDVYWMTISTLRPISDMLQKIDKQVDIFLTSIVRVIQAIQRDIINFLQRDNTLLLSSTRGALEINQFLPKDRDMSLLWDFNWTSGPHPNPQSRLLANDFGFGFNTMTGALTSLMMLGFKNIYLFGADGYLKDPNIRYFSPVEQFYQQKKEEGKNIDTTHSYTAALQADTNAFNANFWFLADKWGMTAWNRDCNIINVNPESRYSVFKKIDIKELIGF